MNLPSRSDFFKRCFGDEAETAQVARPLIFDRIARHIRSFSGEDRLAAVGACLAAKEINTWRFFKLLE